MDKNLWLMTVLVVAALAQSVYGAAPAKRFIADQQNGPSTKMYVEQNTNEENDDEDNDEEMTPDAYNKSSQSSWRERDARNRSGQQADTFRPGRTSESAKPRFYNQNRQKPLSDKMLVENARKTLTGDNELREISRELEILAQNGTIILRGNVNTDTEKRRILAAIRQSAGEAGVDNQMQITNKKSQF